jgi:hypothetical protein
MVPDKLFQSLLKTNNRLRSLNLKNILITNREYYFIAAAEE